MFLSILILRSSTTSVQIDTTVYSSEKEAVRAADSVLARLRNLPPGEDAFRQVNWFLAHQEAVGNNRYLDSALFSYKGLQKWAQENRDTARLIRLQHAINGQLVTIPNYPKLIQGAYKILSFEEHLSRNDSLIAYNALTYSFNQTGQHHLELQLLPLVERLEFDKGGKWAVDLPNRMANSYMSLNQPIAAIPWFRQILKKEKGQGSIIGAVKQLSAIGYMHQLAGNLDSADFYYNDALITMRTMIGEGYEILDFDTTQFNAHIQGNLGGVLLERGKFTQALPLLQFDLNSTLKNSDKNDIAVSGMQVVKCLRNLDQPQAALSTLQTIRFAVGPKKLTNTWIAYLKELGHAHQMLGNNVLAAQYFNKAIQFQDSVNVERERMQTEVSSMALQANLRDQFLREEQKRATDLEKAKEKETALASEKEQERNALLVILLITIIGMSAIGFLLKRVRSQNKAIAEQKGQIEESLIEKEHLIQEIHHRVKNNLQVVSGLLELQSNRFEDDDVKIALKEGKSRVKSIALIHQKLYQTENLAEINFEEYTKELVKNIAMMYAHEGKKIDIHIAMKDQVYDVDTAVPLGLIINELVSNAYKYAFQENDQGILQLRLKNGKQKGDQILVVSDNGIGISEDFNPATAKSLGLKMIRGLSRQLGGRFAWENHQRPINGEAPAFDTGSTFRIEFKSNLFAQKSRTP